MPLALDRDVDLWESPHAAATRKGVSRHLVLTAAARGLLRSQYVARRLVVRRADVDAWQPHAVPVSAA